MEERISVRTFGTFELAFDGRPVERWKAGKARNLLQFLLLRHGRIVSRDVLYDALWPDGPWPKGSSSLKVAAHMLRKVLDEQPQGGPGLRLLTRESGYLLEAAGVPLDFERFIRLADEAHAAQLRGHRAEAAAHYLQADGLYAGDFLPDEPYEWAGAQREWLRSRLLCGLTYLAETNILRGDHVGVIRWCQRMLEVEPFHEEAFRALMLVHGHLGQLEQVQRWYRLCAVRLRQRLQTAPDLATRRLYTRAAHGAFTGRAIDPLVWQRELQPDGHTSLLRSTA
ncbi:winged helix-turn-helix domain-containing protein [Nonomuraea sp. NBC_00507]|uniref:AfsR/SARP family transcriptional regulator n=1 Tax=Nonomuraea sp. NBC_00507 TaxID=2976002 RepID=UPI002E19EF10